MARVGKKVITIPAGVTVTINGADVTVKGAKGELSWTLPTGITAAVEGTELTVSRADESRALRALHGTNRSLLNNMVEGVTKGFEKKLEIVGVGYRVEKQNGKLVLGLGYSHPVVFEEANGVKFECPDSTTIIVKGIDKQAVGQIAAVIRSKRPPEPYLGKGIKYTGERIRRKAGKTGK